MILKFETIVQIFRKIIQLNVVIIFKSTNEYYGKFFTKTAQDKVFFCFSHILNEILWYVKIWNEFTVRNNCLNF